MIMKLEDLVGQEVYVKKIPTYRDDTFNEKIGYVMLNDEDIEDRFYEYAIRFDCINNSFLNYGSTKIECFTKEQYPEYWL